METKYSVAFILCMLNAAWSADVLMESDTEEYLLLEAHYSGEGSKTAIRGSSYSGSSGSTDNTGVSGSAGVDGYGANAIGVYGQAYAYNGTAWAGYFDGNVGAWDFITTSDLSAKTNVRPLTPTLDKVLRLSPKTYQLSASYTGQKKDSPETIGLIAQELEKEFPQLVKQFRRPAVSEKEKTKASASENLKAVSYNGLIPVLIKAMQEQQAQIEALKLLVEASSKR